TLVAEHSGELVGMLHLRNLCHVAWFFFRRLFSKRGVVGGLLMELAFLFAAEAAEFTSIRYRIPVWATDLLGFTPSVRSSVSGASVSFLCEDRAVDRYRTRCLRQFCRTCLSEADWASTSNVCWTLQRCVCS